MSFQIHALPADQFEHLFSLTDEELAERNACRMTVTECPGSPCRVSLEDAQVGEEVILANHMHQPGDSPYRSRHAVFVRAGAIQARPGIGEVPTLLRHRLISVRAFDVSHMMVAADAVEGAQLDTAIESLLARPNVEYIHLHYAKPGCFAASVTRAALR